MAVDLVRLVEHKALLKIGVDSLKNTRYERQHNSSKMGRASWLSSKELAKSTLKTARAWHIKDPQSIFGII